MTKKAVILTLIFLPHLVWAANDTRNEIFAASTALVTGKTAVQKLKSYYQAEDTKTVLGASRTTSRFSTPEPIRIKEMNQAIQQEARWLSLDSSATARTAEQISEAKSLDIMHPVSAEDAQKEIQKLLTKRTQDIQKADYFQSELKQARAVHSLTRVELRNSGSKMTSELAKNLDDELLEIAEQARHLKATKARIVALESQIASIESGEQKLFRVTTVLASEMHPHAAQDFIEELNRSGISKKEIFVTSNRLDKLAVAEAKSLRGSVLSKVAAPISVASTLYLLHSLFISNQDEAAPFSAAQVVAQKAQR